ncbi:MAG TPA: hypothetical protein PLY70_12160 [Saprospiraceae bacterium]|nr:hypothetical protein [Saprospiraceae bacterium]HPN68990.1 hypothetical protein [Saprospiraceae bacterium]
MTNDQKLIAVKALHTLIWVFFNFVLGYIIYAIIQNKIDGYLWIAIGLIIVEALILFRFNYVCPLTIIARRYSDSQKDNFDIYLPNWLARNNKLIYTIIFGLSILGLVFRAFTS